MEKAKKLELLRKCEAELAPLKFANNADDPNVRKWQNYTASVVEKIFGAISRHMDDLKKVRFAPRVHVSEQGAWGDVNHGAIAENHRFRLDGYKQGFADATVFVESAIRHVEDFGDDETVSAPSTAEPKNPSHVTISGQNNRLVLGNDNSINSIHTQQVFADVKKLIHQHAEGDQTLIGTVEAIEKAKDKNSALDKLADFISKCEKYGELGAKLMPYLPALLHGIQMLGH